LPGPAGGALRVVRGRGVDEMEAAELSEAVRGHDDVIVDLGTGDGRFVLREARERPRSLVVGKEPVAQGNGELSIIKK
jgi:tRNA G46 methylase TrmB